MASRFWLAFLCALLLLSSSPALQGQSSTLTSTNLDPITLQAQPLWLGAMDLSNSLLPTFDSFMATLTQQITGLTVYNGQLIDSNKSLTLQVADLQNSVKLWQTQAGTLESKLSDLQTSLNVSIAYTTQVDLDIANAQKHAHELEFQNGLLKIGGTVLLIGSADLALKAFTGKDAIEWVITLVKGK